MQKDGVTIIVTAYNEEGNIKSAVQSAFRVASSILPRFEVIVVDDASLDHTKQICLGLSKANKHVHYVYREKNGGLGCAFLTGIGQATMPYVTWFPGDNDTSPESLKNLVLARKSADIVMTYTVNPETRSYLRRGISWGFTSILNLLLGYRLKYYNGCFISKTELVRSCQLKSWGHAIFAELKVRLLRKGATYKQIPFYHIGRNSGRTTAFRWKNILGTLYTMKILIFDNRVKRSI